MSNRFWQCDDTNRLWSFFDYEMYDSVSEKNEDSPIKKLYSGFIDILKWSEYNSCI